MAKHYRELEREREKVKVKSNRWRTNRKSVLIDWTLISVHSLPPKQNVLVETQDRSLRRISELKEQCALEQQAKAHLEDILRSDLEERDNLIIVLQTKVFY